MPRRNLTRYWLYYVEMLIMTHKHRESCHFDAQLTFATGPSLCMFDLWHCLSTIQHYHYVSTPGPKSVMGWKGVGKGAVVSTTSDDGDTLFFQESGLFVLDANQHRLKTRNEFIWQRINKHRIRLFHGRFGRENAVQLFDLTPDYASKQWSNESSHVCGDDLYNGLIFLENNELEFTWRITGPRKNEHLHYTYKE